MVALGVTCQSASDNNAAVAHLNTKRPTDAPEGAEFHDSVIPVPAGVAENPVGRHCPPVAPSSLLFGVTAVKFDFSPRIQTV